MDFDIFSRQLLSLMSDKGYTYAFTFKETRDIFLYYFTVYRRYTHQEHPPIKNSKLRELLDSISYDGYMEYYPENYYDMIDAYFETPFKECNRNISHFFSGKIRYLRFCENVLKEE